MIPNVNISCLSWGVIGGIIIFNSSMKQRLIIAVSCYLGVTLGVLFSHVSIMETTQSEMSFLISIFKLTER